MRNVFFSAALFISAFSQTSISSVYAASTIQRPFADATAAVQITAYRITNNKSSNQAINWSDLHDTVSRAAEASGQTLTPTETDGDGFSQFVISAPTTTTSGAGSLLSGSDLLLQTLNTVGHAVVRETASISTTNYQVGSSKGTASNPYIVQEISLPPSEERGFIETGFTGVVVPLMGQDGHHLLLKGEISLSTLNSIKTVTIDGMSMLLPQISVQKFMTNRWLTSGQTLVVEKNPDQRHAHEITLLAITPVVTTIRMNRK